MEKITKKEFLETLRSNKSILMGSIFRWMDEKAIRAMEKTMLDETMERRTVTENHANYIVFSNGGRLDFDQIGKKEYFKHENAGGVKYILQRTAEHDDFDDVENLSYIIYAIAD